MYSEGADLSTLPEDRVLVLTRDINAPRALVFRAWTEPEHLARLADFIEAISND